VSYRCCRCQYDGADGDAHVKESGHPRCVVCTRSLQIMQRQTCQACVATVRADLNDIEQLYALLPAELGRLASAGLEPIGKGDDQPMPGGDILTLLGPGSNGRSQIMGVRVAGGRRDDSHGHDEWPSDPQSVAWELSRWEDEIRRQRGEHAASTLPNVHAARIYVNRQITWASDFYPDFAEMASDLRKLRMRLAQATATDSPPERGCPCLDCGSTLLREWTDRGLSDDWVCHHCRRIYSHAEHHLAVAQHMSEQQVAE
jgi:hypothetical protein